MPRHFFMPGFKNTTTYLKPYKPNLLIKTRRAKMIAFKEDERKIIITMSGDKEDYLNTLKTLVFMLGNQNPLCPLKPEETILITNLVSDMLPDFTMLETRLAS